MIVRYAVARYVPNRQRGEFINVGILVEVDGQTGFQRGTRLDTLAKEETDSFLALERALTDLESKIATGKIQIDALVASEPVLIFTKVNESQTDNLDDFYDQQFTRFVRPSLRLTDNELLEQRSPITKDPAFRYFVINYGCKNHGSNNPFDCDGCQQDYADLIDTIAISFPTSIFDQIRKSALERNKEITTDTDQDKKKSE